MERQSLGEKGKGRYVDRKTASRELSLNGGGESLFLTEKGSCPRLTWKM